MSKDRDELTQKVIGLAAQVLSDEGPEALTVRRVAQESGASTQLIYTLFGGKFGLVDGLYKEGFRRFENFIREKQDPKDAKKNLECIWLGYREFAIQHKPLFNVMFTRQVAEYTPPQESLRLAWEAFGTFIRAVERAQAEGHLQGDPVFIVRKLWSQVHGVVTLEMMGHLYGTAGEKICRDFMDDLWNRTA